MKVYVNWQTKEIISQAHYYRLIAATATEYEADDGLLDDYLEDRYTSLELFRMPEEERTEVRSDFAEWCYNSAKNALVEDFDEYEF